MIRWSVERLTFVYCIRILRNFWFSNRFRRDLLSQNVSRAFKCFFCMGFSFCIMHKLWKCFSVIVYLNSLIFLLSRLWSIAGKTNCPKTNCWWRWCRIWFLSLASTTFHIDHQIVNYILHLQASVYSNRIIKVRVAFQLFRIIVLNIYFNEYWL